MNNVVRAYDAAMVDVNNSDMSLIVRINTSGVDRYKTVIDPYGAKLENYRKNPVVLWEHAKDPRRFTDPIARNLWVRTDGGQRPTSLLAKPQFLQDDFSRQRWEWYRDGVLNAFSVNILPVDGSASPPTKEETRTRPEWESAHTIYREWDLAEYSGTTVPGNADALVADRAVQLLDLVSRSLLWLPDDVKELVEERAKTVTTDASEPAKEADARGYHVAQEGPVWVIRDSEDVLITSDPNEAVIRRAHAAMQVSRTWQDLHDDMAGAQAKRNAEIARYLKDELDLRLKGTV